MSSTDSEDESHKTRSSFIRQLVHSSADMIVTNPEGIIQIPKVIVQYWDDLALLPADVKDCIDTWLPAEKQGIERLLFDSSSAKQFIGSRLGSRHESAFDKCWHPAMQSDYFRLCYIYVEGGCYVDTDDVYSGSNFENLFADTRFKIQPLCYDVSNNSMVSPSVFTRPTGKDQDWIYYFNNNPLIAKCGHPIVKRALDEATKNLENCSTDKLPEIQSTTGPGNLTKTIFDLASTTPQIEQSFLIMRDWESIAKPRWELSYRDDLRNWRNYTHVTQGR